MSLRAKNVLAPASLFAAIVLVAAVGYALRGRTEPPREQTQAVESQTTTPAAVPFFKDITQESGLDFSHTPAATTRYFMPDIMAPGAALLDFDLDGDLDIYLINGSRSLQFLAKDDQPSSSDNEPLATNRLFRQEPDGTFVDVTEQSGLGDTGYGMGVAVGDINNDGHPDLYVTNYGPDRLFLNRRDGTFADVTESAGINNDHWGASASFFDFDRDGRLDIFVTNYVDYYLSRRCFKSTGRQDYCNPMNFRGTNDKLYHNVSGSLSVTESDEASGSHLESVRFEDVSLAAGIAKQQATGLGVLCADFDGDRWPDIFVANDALQNFLWINQHDGTFLDRAIPWGVAADARGRPQSSMGIAYGDVNGDANMDLLVTHFFGDSNTLYISTPPFGFMDRSAACGLVATTLSSTGFGVVLIDIDHDGDLDMVVANGHVTRTNSDPVSRGDATDDKSFWQPYAETNQLFINDGAGQFSLRVDPDGPFGGISEVSRGLAYGDVDRDGDLDLLVANGAGVARLLLNVAPKQGHWLMVRAVEPTWGGRDAYGAVIHVTAGGNKWVQLIQSGSSYLSAVQPWAHFGLGEVDKVDQLRVLWPDGTEEIFAGGRTDRVVTLRHGEGRHP